MAVYVFNCEDCGVFELSRSIRESPGWTTKCPTCGKISGRNLKAEHPIRGSTLSGWPILSDSAGVHPSQVAEAAALDKELGVPTNYHPDGRLEFRNNGHRRKWLKAHGMYDKRSY